MEAIENKCKGRVLVVDDERPETKVLYMSGYTQQMEDCRSAGEEKAVELEWFEGFNAVVGSRKVRGIDSHEIIRLSHDRTLQETVVRFVGAAVEGDERVDLMAELSH